MLKFNLLFAISLILIIMLINKRVILTIFNILYVFDMSVNLLSIKKLLNIDIKIAFYKKNYI